MDNKAVTKCIVDFLDSYLTEAGQDGFVVGVSGGVDSAVCSVLAAMTTKPVLCVMLPINQAASQVDRAKEHITWLTANYPNVEATEVDLSDAYRAFVGSLPVAGVEEVDMLNDANARARLRMTTLYYFAGQRRALVVGTGNKIEDFGIGFFTKYGDGGVDISPIGDLTKSEVFELADYLGVPGSILEAAPTDGLFGDDRSDEDQIGATYPELEWAMQQAEQGANPLSFTPRQEEVYNIYIRRNRTNQHKLTPPPVCIIPNKKPKA